MAIRLHRPGEAFRRIPRLGLAYGAGAAGTVALRRSRVLQPRTPDFLLQIPQTDWLVMSVDMEPAEAQFSKPPCRSSTPVPQKMVV